MKKMKGHRDLSHMTKQHNNEQIRENTITFMLNSVTVYNVLFFFQYAANLLFTLLTFYDSMPECTMQSTIESRYSKTKLGGTPELHGRGQ